jgi:hypothetical protein
VQLCTRSSINTVMQNTNAPLFRLIPRDVTVVCGSQAIRLNYALRSSRGRCMAQTDLPYALEIEDQRQRLSHFRFRIARLRYQASRS